MFARVRNVGLSNLILGDATEDEAVSSVKSVPNLWLLTSGPPPPHPYEWLGSGHVRELMSRLSGSYEQGRATFPAVGRAKQMLDRVGAHTLGAVMNNVRAPAGSYAYDYANYSSALGGSPKPLAEEPPDLEQRAASN
jgi:Mrp family chromosome partitioning ATPase